MMIALTGQARSGKNTVAKILSKLAEQDGKTVCERGFSDLIKISMTSLFENNASWADAFKLYGNVKLDVWGDGDRVIELSGRQFIQRYGTEAHRDLFGEDFWVDMLLPHDGWRKRFNNADACIITDLRFESEAKRVKQLKGLIWRVDRADAYSSDTHSSEMPLNERWIDATINNDDDLESLYETVAKVYDRIV